jgi:hypothetical protein
MNFDYDTATLKATWGVYAIVNKGSGRSYIGSTGDCFLARWKGHWYKLQSGKADNYALQWDWSFYGPDNFAFQILESFTGKLGSYRNGYDTGPWARHREAHWIVQARNIYNVQMPAQSMLAGEHAQQTSSRLWEAFYGSPPPLCPKHDWWSNIGKR